MTTLKLSSTRFQSEHHSSSITKCAHGVGVYHNVDVWNEIIINDQRFCATYQSGISYCGNSYSAPSNRLEFSDDAYMSTDELCTLLNELYESDFDDNDLIEKKLEEAKEYCAHIDTIEKLWEVYEFFNDNNPGYVWDYIDSRHTDNIEDYEEDEKTGVLVLKKASIDD